MQVENTSLLQFSPKTSYKYWISSPCTERSCALFKYFLRDGTRTCYMYGDRSIRVFHQEAIIPGSNAHRKVGCSFRQWY